MVIAGSARAQSDYSHPYQWRTLAGVSSFGFHDGPASASQFAHPYALVVAASGTLYVADTTNCVIRQISGGVVTTLAGQPGVPGFADGTGSSALFSYPCGLALDASGDLLVCDTDNQVVRKVTTSGVVTTWVGSPGTLGSSDGTGASARFWNPVGIAVDATGNCYVADSDNATIRKITPAGVVTTLAGTAGVTGRQDGSGPSAQFAYPFGIAVDLNGNVYVADISNATVRKVTSAGVVTTFAGQAGASGAADGTGSAARFHSPNAVAVGASGTVYVADTGGDTIRAITPGGTVSTLAGTANVAGSADGTGAAAGFTAPSGVTVAPGGTIYVADTGNATIRSVSVSGSVSTIAGIAAQAGAVDGSALVARFSGPWGVARDAAGNAYIPDCFNNTVRKVTPAGVVTTLAGTAGLSGSQDGVGAQARFNGPTWAAVDGSGVVWVSDTGNDTIRRIATDGTVSTVAGSAGQSGSSDGTGGSALFSSPAGLAFDGSGNLIVADTGNDTLRSISPSGAVTTLAGTAGSPGTADGPSASALFDDPQGVAVDASGVIYVADSGNSEIRRISASGTVSTLAGSPANAGGGQDGTGSAAGFYGPGGIAVDGSGTLYVTDSYNNLVRRVSPTGVVSTIGGVYQVDNEIDGVGMTAQFDTPMGIACDGAGNLIVADSFNNVIRAGIPYAASSTGGGTSPSDGSGTAPVEGPSIAMPPASLSVAAGAPAAFSVVATGSGSLSYQWTHDGAAIAGATGSSFSIAAAKSSDSGAYAVTVSDAGGSLVSGSAFLTVSSSAGPALSSQPQSCDADVGATVVLSVGATGGAGAAQAPSAEARVAGFSYQWFFDGKALADGGGISGAQGSTLVLGGGSAQSGSYACLVMNASGSALSVPALLNIAPASDPGRLINLSVRAQAGAGSSVLIAGFATGGASTSGTQSVLVRGIGPALSGYGVSGVLADPMLTVNQGQTVLAANSGWADNAQITSADRAVGAFALTDSASADAALLLPSLPRNSYTAFVSGRTGDSGLALVEVYDATPSGTYTASAPRLVNLSARGQVGTGGSIMVAGFVVGGSTAKTVLIRGAGPALAPFGLTGLLADPKLVIYQGSTVLASNAGWNGDPAIASVAASVGAFSWGSSATPDAALLVTLPPGAYTVELSGAASDSGLALVELYDAD